MPSPTFDSGYFGLTGGVGCGKSTVASYFLALGAKVIDADQIGHDLLRPARPAFKEILRQFGGEILSPEGAIDRKRLGAIIFAHPEKRRALNAVLHPPIIARQEELAARYRRAKQNAVIIVDAALIYEAGIESRFRKVLVAWCSPEQQIERLMAKPGLSRGEAAARVAAQMPQDEKRRRADYVIDCSVSLDHTRAQVEGIYPRLVRLAEDGP
ncbi:MAG: dephospho-CoA kinase [Terriglobia bacterium]